MSGGGRQLDIFVYCIVCGGMRFTFGSWDLGFQWNGNFEIQKLLDLTLRGGILKL
jgi:hypothetical protein